MSVEVEASAADFDDGPRDSIGAATRSVFDQMMGRTSNLKTQGFNDLRDFDAPEASASVVSSNARVFATPTDASDMLTTVVTGVNMDL